VGYREEHRAFACITKHHFNGPANFPKTLCPAPLSGLPPFPRSSRLPSLIALRFEDDLRVVRVSKFKSFHDLPQAGDGGGDRRRRRRCRKFRGDSTGARPLTPWIRRDCIAALGVVDAPLALPASRLALWPWLPVGSVGLDLGHAFLWCLWVGGTASFVSKSVAVLFWEFTIISLAINYFWISYTSENKMKAFPWVAICLLGADHRFSYLLVMIPLAK
jgi:hypothetical protein